MAVHPLVVHFPIAFILVSTVTLLYTLLRPNWLDRKSQAGRFALEGFLNGAFGLGYAGLVLSVATGLYDMQASPKLLVREGWLSLAIFHIISSVSLVVVYGFLLYRRFVVLPPVNVSGDGEGYGSSVAQSDSKQSNGAFVFDRISIGLAVLGLILLVVAGFLGGQMVYEYRVGIS